MQKTAAAVTVVCMVGVFLARRQIGVLFGASAEANVGVARYLPYFLTTLLPYLLVHAEPVCTLLLLLILPLFWKPTGVWLAVPLAQVLTFGIGLVEYRLAAGRAPD